MLAFSGSVMSDCYVFADHELISVKFSGKDFRVMSSHLQSLAEDGLSLTVAEQFSHDTGRPRKLWGLILMDLPAPDIHSPSLAGTLG